MVYHPHIHIARPKVKRQEAKRKYYWIIAKSNKSGTTMIFGCKPTRQEAEEAMSKIHNAICEIVEDTTKDEDEFSRRLRGGELMKSGDIDEAARHFDHTQRV